MPSPIEADRLLAKLSAGVTSSPDLEQALGVSQSWVARLLRRLTNEGVVLRIGSTRGARYGLRREIAGIGSQWPLRLIDRTGQVRNVGTLYSLAADQYFFNAEASAVQAGFAWSGISDGIPYFLQDQRPGGFLGQAVPLRYPELKLPQRVSDWTDDHYLRYLTQHGSDTVGDLILGNSAFDEYLSNLRIRSRIQSAQREAYYSQLAKEVMSGGLPGSSAQGEHPKFAIVLDDLDGPRPVIVKFSPPMDTRTGRRWADLLVAEHTAHRILQNAGLAACASRIFVFGDRTYLEVTRFDRAGFEGRVGTTSLWAIDTTQYGGLDNWIDAAARLHKDRRIDAETLEQVRLAASFGGLIANTDRHFGNLAFYDDYTGIFKLAPIYDMLPMLFAPQHDQIVERTFEPPHPTADTVCTWPRARALAEGYWRALTTEPLIGTDFKTIGATCLKLLEALPRSGSYM